MIPQPPPGQGPVDPRGAFSPPPPPSGVAGAPGPMTGHPPAPGGYPPPPMMMPPMMMPPPYYPPPVKSHSFARAIFTTLATTIFGLSIALNIYLLVFSSITSSAGGVGRAETLVDGDSHQQVAVYLIHGVIDDEMSRQIDKDLTAAEKDSSIKAVVLDIDTPGGGVTSSDEIYARIRRFKEKKNVPVVATMGALATSGGYYVACACDYVFAETTSWTGNIGVLQEGFNVYELFQKWGIKETTIIPAGAPYKNAGSMFQPERPEDVAYMRAMVEEAFDRFKFVVTTGRTGKLTQPIDQIANGKVYIGPVAKKLGLIDEIGYANDAYDKAAALASLKDKQVVRYQRQPSLMSLFGASNNTAPPGASSGGPISFNGASLHLDQNSIRELMTPRLMYLWRGR